MPYYEDLEDEEFFDASPYDELLSSLQEAMMNNVKKSIMDELERLRAENEELKEFRADKEKFDRELNKAKLDYERKLRGAKDELRKERLHELFGNDPEVAWGVTWDNVYPEKCNKCDEHRHLHFKAPSGKELTEQCPHCGKSKSVFSPLEYTLVRFTKRHGWDKEPTRYYRYIENKEYDEFNDETSNLYKPGTPFDKVYSYRIVFLDKKTCEEYCAWLNDKEK